MNFFAFGTAVVEVWLCYGSNIAFIYLGQIWAVIHFRKWATSLLFIWATSKPKEICYRGSSNGGVKTRSSACILLLVLLMAFLVILQGFQCTCSGLTGKMIGMKHFGGQTVSAQLSHLIWHCKDVVGEEKRILGKPCQIRKSSFGFGCDLS